MRRGKSMRGFAIGAAIEYLLDPLDGARRRAMVRDKVTKAATKGARFARAARRDLRNRRAGVAGRARGLAGELRRRAAGELVDDAVLEARVRERLGHVVAHPGHITVRAEAGHVMLSGSAFETEVERSVAAISRVRGVRDVSDELRVEPGAPDPASVPPDVAPLSSRMLRHWSPTARVVAGSAGALMALRGKRRGGAIGRLSEVAGLGLIARGLAHSAEPGAELVGLGNPRGADRQTAAPAGAAIAPGAGAAAG